MSRSLEIDDELNRRAWLISDLLYVLSYMKIEYFRHIHAIAYGIASRTGAK